MDDVIEVMEALERVLGNPCPPCSGSRRFTRFPAAANGATVRFPLAPPEKWLSWAWRGERELFRASVCAPAPLLCVWGCAEEGRMSTMDWAFASSEGRGPGGVWAWSGGVTLRPLVPVLAACGCDCECVCCCGGPRS